MLLCDTHDYIIDIHVAALVSTHYSAIFFLSHLDLGYKTFIYMLVGSTTLPLFSCQLLNRALLEARLLQNGNGCDQAQSISGLLRDPSEDDLENNRQKQFNTNSRAGEMLMEKCTQEYVLTQQTMVFRDACPTSLGIPWHDAPL